MTQDHLPQPGEPIAILGFGCRFPGGATTPSKLWQLLKQPRDVCTKIPPSRFDSDGFYHPNGEYHGHSNIQHAYLLAGDQDHQLFDADFFSISAAEAAAIDPQQRLLLECVYEALEEGGQRMAGLRGTDTAVFVGVMREGYSDIQFRNLDTLPTHFPTGTARSILSNRVSYTFDWHGPSMTIDTACSSSLVAVHQAVQTLRSGTSRVAVAAGANLILGPEVFIAESTFHMLSPQGRSHMWDARADGYGRGDGVAAVVLKRLSDAIADGDPIQCILRETGVNQDGRTKGITVPSADAQVALVEDTYHRAGLDLNSPEGRPQFFEAHGTGTPTGDPLEAEAIHRSIASRLGDENESDTNLFVGSIKSIIGHTEGTAGIAGLMKVALAMQHGTIPPNLLFEKLNPALIPFYKNIEVPVKAVEWPEVTAGQPRRASINSFGFGGTNAHVIIESYQPLLHVDSLDDVGGDSRDSLLPFVFSAASRSSLKNYLKELLLFLEKNPHINPEDLAYHLNTKRSIFPFRISYLARNINELRESIKKSLAQSDWEAALSRAPTTPMRILGIFTGQGAQWPGMGRELIHHLPFVQARLSHLDDALAQLPKADRPSWTLANEMLSNGLAAKLNTAAISQPLCTALQIILVDLLRASGINFAAVVGHSSGEIAAAYACGMISSHDAIIISYYRGVLACLSGTSSGQPGAMMAVNTTGEDAEDLCSLPEFDKRLCVAAYNSPVSVTLSGDEDAIQLAKAVFDDEGKFARELRVDKAYHSHHMLPCVIPYIGALTQASIKVQRPRDECTWFSSVHRGQRMGSTELEALKASYWSDNMTQPVLFSYAVEMGANDNQANINMALEIGPHSALHAPIDDTLKTTSKSSILYGSCLIRNKNAADTFVESIELVWKNAPEGTVNFDSFQRAVSVNPEYKPTMIRHLPTYQWQHDRVHWSESRRSRVLRTRAKPAHPLLGTLSPDSTGSDMMWQNVMRIIDLPWLTGHQLSGQVVFPAAGYVALAIEAGLEFAQDKQDVFQIELEDLSIEKAITFADDRIGVETMFFLHIEKTETRRDGKIVYGSWRYHSATKGSSTTSQNASGRIKLVLTESPHPGASRRPILPSQDADLSNMTKVDKDDFYSELKKIGYLYSGRFRTLSLLKRKLGHSRGFLNLPSPDELHISEQKLLVHPGILDSAFQAQFLAYSWPGDGSFRTLHVPTSIRRLRVDPSACRHSCEHNLLSFDSTASRDIEGRSRRGGIYGDVNIYTGDGRFGLIQVEGVTFIPLVTASASEDREMFLENVYGPAEPDFSAVTTIREDTEEEEKLALVLERIAFFYIRKLKFELESARIISTEGQFQNILAYANHIVDQEMRRKSQQVKRWGSDTAEYIDNLMALYSDSIDMKVLRIVGENLSALVTGSTTTVEITQQLLVDGSLESYYTDGLGMKKSLQFLTSILSQITHRYPHMRIVEVGDTAAVRGIILNAIEGQFDEYTVTSATTTDAIEESSSKFTKTLTFNPMDIEGDIVSKGFQEHSYDLAIVFFTLFATRDLKSTLNKLRKLIKPGGYLVMLETANYTLRAMTLGVIHGWLHGTGSGISEPALSPPQWNALLMDSGFSGVQVIAPGVDKRLGPLSIMVSRAVDDQINMLIEPSEEASSLSKIQSCLVVTGTTLSNHRLAQSAVRLLGRHCASKPVIVQGVTELVGMRDLSHHMTVLYLADLDEPVLKDLTPVMFEGLKILFKQAKNVLWVTKGRRDGNPDSNMSVGLGRVLVSEIPHLRVHFIDFDTETKPTARVLVDSLLRQQILISIEDRGSSEEILWSQEREIFIEGSQEYIPRIKPNKRWNDAYNSSSREIRRQVRPSEEAVEITKDDGLCRLLVRQLPENNATEKANLVRVLYVASSPVPITSTTALYPCVGLEMQTSRPVVALLNRITSIAEVPIGLMCSCDTSWELPAEAAKLTRSLAAYFLARFACDGICPKTTLLLIEPDLLTARIFKLLIETNTVRVVSITNDPDKVDEDFTYIHPLTSKHLISHRLPPRISVAVDFTTSATVDQSLADVIKPILSKSVNLIDSTLFHPGEDVPVSKEFKVPVMLRDAVSTVSNLCASVKSNTDITVVSPEDYVKVPQAWSTVIDWTTPETLSVPVQLSSSETLVHSNRTYLLVGLASAGGLGVTLAEWMINHGARHIILTSRHPKIDPAWISLHASQGVDIQVIANDVTDRDSLKDMIDSIRLSCPPIAGVVNGAMVLSDGSFEQMTYEQMVQVLRPKVEGTRHLDDNFYDDPLDFFILFPSLANVVGNPGQANYAAANMYMTGVATQRRKRGVAGSAIDLGSIVGIGFITREARDGVLSKLGAMGFAKLSEHDFLEAFATAIIAGRPCSAEAEELITGLNTDAPVDSTISNTPYWREDPRFFHVIKTTAGSRNTGAKKVVDSAQTTTREMLQEASDQEHTRQIVQDAFLKKLTAVLQLNAERASGTAQLLQQAPEELGIDSLAAVEIRSWFLQEMDLDVLVLKLITATSISEILDFAIDNLPKGLAAVGGNDQRVDEQEKLSPSSTDVSVTLNSSSSHSTSTPILTPQMSMADSFVVVKTDDETKLSSVASIRHEELSKPLTINTPELPFAVQEAATRVAIEKRVPMSYGQRGFWFMNQLASSDQTLFNGTICLLLTGEINVSDLAKAVVALGRRHEGLRAAFYDDNDEQPMQTILADSSLTLETRTATSIDDVRRQFNELNKYVYDIANGQTLRIILMTESPTRNHLVIGYNHINIDATSLLVVIAELSRLYNGEKLAPPLLQQTDFAQQQHERLRTGQWADAIAYWRNEFRDLPETLPILNISPQSFKPRPSRATYRHHKSADVRITGALATKIRAVCKKYKVTPFHLYCTVFQITLGRLAGTEDICLGVANANRSDRGAMEAVGIFLNLFPLRLKTSCSTPFSELLEQTRSKVLLGLQNSAVPFDEILNQVGVQRGPTHLPLFQAFVDYVPIREKQRFGRDCDLNHEEYNFGETMYDIMLGIVDNPEGDAWLSFLLQEELYAEENADMLLQCYLNLLEEFVDNNGLRAGEPQMFSKVEVDQALSLGQGLELEFGNGTLLDEIDATAMFNSDSVALKDTQGNCLTYKQMTLKSYAIARSLTALGVSRGSRVAILQNPSISWICSLLGVWRIGAVLVPLEVTQGSKRLATIAQDADLAAIIVHNDTLSLLSELGWNKTEMVINLSNLSPQTGVITSQTLHKPTAKDEALILYTSGSTGLPKGISMPHIMLLNSIKGFLHHWPMSPQTVLQQIALSFDLAWWQSFVGLATGGTVVVAGLESRKDPVALTELIATERITLTVAVPSEIISWLNFGEVEKLKRSSWAWHISAGEDFGIKLTQLLQSLAKSDLCVLNAYGPAETIIPLVHEVHYEQLSATDISIPIGKVMPNYTVYVVDDQGHPLPPRVPGQLMIGGAGVANKYINNPALSEERFPIATHSPPHFVEKGWVRTHLSGDRGFLRVDGEFVMVGRMAGDTQVKLRGQRMDVKEIESCIIDISQGQVVDAVVHMRQQVDGDAATAFLVAHVVLAPEATSRYPTTLALDEYLSRLTAELPLPAYMRPSIMIALSSLPLSHHGKIDRKSLSEAPIRSGHRVSQKAQSGMPVRDRKVESQDNIKQIWQQFLGEAAECIDIHPDSDFFSVGGNSLLLLSIQAEMKRRFGVKVSLTQLFESSTLEQMASLINPKETAETTKIDWIEEVKVDPEIQPLKAPLMLSQPRIGLVVVLTGSTGFLGRNILHKLIASPHISTIHCVAVRDRSKLIKFPPSKITIHMGNLTQPRLGLPEDTSRRLFLEAHAIIHNGADVSFMKSYSSIRTANLGSTKELVRLSLQHGKGTRIHFISTSGVTLIDGRELHEEPLGDNHPRNSTGINGYVVSKWACEKYLENASAATGLPVTIHRPTIVIGPDAPRLDIMHNVLYYSEQLRCVPQLPSLERWFQFVDIEEVAQEIGAAVIAHADRVDTMQYKNITGKEENVTKMDRFGHYMETNKGYTFDHTSLNDWVDQASRIGLAPEIAEYLRSGARNENGGEEWVFPRIWGKPRA
ncbi:hypothetical protein BGW36DRAFT_432439 [Talaromyces proteolyticus]|uniref:Uncharacterized protein n=1 Tax=Talaromyces proteolyticus TaxID=1131652 RepID=A0AAD4KL38_9EURO|nr:uncharacterized protein BGW36DRAFT_432439 [Talaromyces proteolyticus]KAH8690646.1 hypothetical protein BGW36DRAFT_432439 [Talaromyces proteolyticus]